MATVDRISVVASFRDLWGPVAVYAPLSVGLAIIAFRELGPWVGVGAAVAGFVLWTFMEYWIHRLVLHMIPRGRVRRYLAGRHIMHHRNPLGHPGVALLWVSALVAAAVFTGIGLLFDLGVAAALMTGVVTGYLSYEYTHLASHVGMAPVTPWGEWLRRHHLGHHDDCPKHNYAIVMPMWDRVFQTRWQPPGETGLRFPDPATNATLTAPHSDAA